MAKKSLNKVILSGNLGKDPMMRKTPDGSPVAVTTLAVNGYKEGDVSWANLVAFNKTAELFEEYLHKGDAIAVVGRYQVRPYEYEGETRYNHEIIVEDVTFLGGGNGGNGNGNGAKRSGSGNSNGYSNSYGEEEAPRSKKGSAIFDDENEAPRPARRRKPADEDDIPF